MIFKGFIDIGITKQLVEFSTIIEEDLFMTVFLSLLKVEGRKKDARMIFDTLILHLKKLGFN